MKTKFTKGRWLISFTGVQRIISVGTAIICNVFPNHTGKEEAEANSKLISTSPEMFYRIVLIANEEGWQTLFDIIEKVTGEKYKYGSKEFKNLVEEAIEFFKK